LVEPDHASTSQVVYDLLKANDISIEHDTALCIYTAIVTDTGSFQYESVNEKVFECAADLVRCGVKPDFVSKMLFQRDKLSKLRLIAKAFETIEMCCDGKVAFIEITKEMLDITGAVKEDTDTLVNSIRSLASVEIACMLREDDDGIKVSLRSKNYADVSQIAQKLGGGGHVKAAGVTFKGDFNFEKVKNILKNEIKKVL